MDILLDPHPLLRRVADPLTPAELRAPAMQSLIDAMLAMLPAHGLIGMAAPQIGVSKRLFVLHFTDEAGEHGPLSLANPRLLRAEGELAWTEASPCRPGWTGEVARYARIHCRGLDRHGRPRTIRAGGLLAVCIQHEIDHLNGVLCLDKARNLRMSPDTIGLAGRTFVADNCAIGG